MDGKGDILHQERFLGLGNRSQFFPLEVPVLEGNTDDAHILQQILPGTQEVLFLCVPADGNGRRQFLLVQDDDEVIDRAGNGEAGCLVGDVEELQRVGRHGDLKPAVGGGNGADLVLGDTDLDVFDGIAFFIDNLPADGDAFLRRQ